MNENRGKRSRRRTEVMGSGAAKIGRNTDEGEAGVRQQRCEAGAEENRGVHQGGEMEGMSVGR